ncbi:MAG: T9SS type A sorting domain-containing protein [Lewinellaceae bacterium]|nr:T9SS type A sorting domain-containing protein [Lewinellaceae bacterium]
MINSVIGPTYEPLILLPEDAPLSRVLLSEPGNEGMDKKNEMSAILIAIPNPAKDVTTIEYRLPDGNDSGRLVFTSFDGQLIEEKEILDNSGKIVFSTANLPNGVYFYTLLSGDKKWKSLKLVVAR